MCAPLRIKNYYEAPVERPAADRAWIDAFRQRADDHRLSVLALFMFVTAARIGEAIKLGPEHLELEKKRIVGPSGKNGDPCIYYLTDELVQEFRLLRPERIFYGEGPWRLFGWATTVGPRQAWRTTCERAGIPCLTPHEAGRHGFGTETIVRKRIDVVTAAKLGRWRDPAVLLKRYAHAIGLGETAEDVFGKGAVRVTRLAQASPKQAKKR